MGSDSVHKLTMPKWGLSMTHGKVVEWLLEEGAEVTAGSEVVEVETEKIVGAVESSVEGVVRRHVAQLGQDIPIGGLLAVIAPASVSDDEIDQVVANFVVEDIADEGFTNEPQPEFIDVGERRLRFIKRGDGGQPAVLIHGFTGSLDSWLFNHAELATDRTVYALDLPGHGQSSKDVGDGSLDTMISIVIDWLDALGLPQVHLVGHSLGGAIALGVTIQNSDRVLSCTLIASAALGEEIDAEYVAGVVESNRRKQLKPFMERLFADPERTTRKMVDDLLKFKRVDGVQQAISKLADSIVAGGKQQTVYRNQLSESSTPTQIIWGAEDALLPKSHTAGFSDHISVAVLPNCGHMVQMESAAKVNQLVTEFLASLEE